VTAHSRYPHLLSPGRIGPLTLRNRTCLTPMGTNLESEDGTPGERITRFYEERAKGGVGMIIVGVTGVAWPLGVSNPRNMGLSRDEFVPAFRALTDRVHAHGAAIAVQLQHAGKTALQDVIAGRPLWVPSELPEKPGDLFAALAPEEIAAVSEPFTQPTSKFSLHVVTEDDVVTLCGWFADAAERARAAGFDGVEIHAGHGYLISSFLSRSSNLRDDEFGGPLENRARVFVRVIRAVRERVGADFPVWCRLDGVEYRKKNGITEEDAQRTAEIGVAAGLDAVHVSAYADPRSAIAFTDAPLPHQPSAYLDLARGIKRRVGVPVIAVGRIAPDVADRAIADGDADFVAWGRALIADPELPAKLARGDASVSRCIYSYRCVGNIFLRRSASCAVNPRAGREGEPSLALAPAARPRRVLVAGGGPAGLEAARLLAQRGHAVTLCEREPELGGLALAAVAAEPNNAPLLAELLRAVATAKIEVRLASTVTPALVAELDPDAVVIAIGARRARPEVPGANAAHVFDPWQLRGGIEAALANGPRVAVVGGGLVGVEIAERLAELGATVTLLAEQKVIAAEMAPPRRWRALHLLAEHGVERHSPATLLAIESGRVRFASADGAPRELAVDAVVLSEALAPDDALAAALASSRAQVHRIGDCVAPRTFEEAIYEATVAAGAI
jgi:2,4-dienoyl-CoA reductase-like NADH-dependent reductase (Old Yellow Enzyme family)/thioredoxin reductase